RPDRLRHTNHIAAHDPGWLDVYRFTQLILRNLFRFREGLRCFFLRDLFGSVGLAVVVLPLLHVREVNVSTRGQLIPWRDKPSGSHGVPGAEVAVYILAGNLGVTRERRGRYFLAVLQLRAI